ncbi:unnamed protein product [Echinostoma caproni]|uniref:C2H2-type domain-containing protein n=1 Tax=Echinostoma caproni TaxID=27848 RepID=A0A183BF60_9TREM|nr:unnamed protein product [Echinostoma caproni]
MSSPPNDRTASAAQLTSLMPESVLQCPICAKPCKSKAGLTLHKRVHPPETVTALATRSVPDNPPPESSQPQPQLVGPHSCSLCPLSFTTATGLSQHHRHRHPTEYNASKLSRIRPSTRNWTPSEDSELITQANLLFRPGSRKIDLYTRLHEILPLRTIESIKKRLAHLNWTPASPSPHASVPPLPCTPTPSVPSLSPISNQVTPPNGQPPDPPAPNSPLDPPSHPHTIYPESRPLLERAIEYLSDCTDNAFSPSTLLNIALSALAPDPDIPSLHRLLDAHAVENFPHLWKPSRPRSNRISRPPDIGSRRPRQSAKRIERRAQHAHIQTLFSHRRKDAAEEVFSGRWRTSYRDDAFWSADYATYWSEKLLSLQPVLVNGSEVLSTDEAAERMADALHNTVDGKVLSCHKHSGPSSPANFDVIYYLRRRVVSEAPVPPTISTAEVAVGNLNPLLTSSSRASDNIYCRGGCRKPESLAHILQECPITHDHRCRRHNNVACYLAKLFRRNGQTTFTEPRLPTGSTYCKPDLLVVHGSTAFVCDVAICAPHLISHTFLHKQNKYSTPEITTQIKTLLNSQNCTPSSILHTPIIITYNGFIHRKSHSALKKLKFSDIDIQDILTLAMRGSLKAYYGYMRGA